MRYTIVGGRFSIPFEDKELYCDDRPMLAHIIWAKNDKWYCLRIDNCEEFKQIDIEPIKINKVQIRDLKFKQASNHYSAYQLVKIIGEDKKAIIVSSFQLKEQRNRTIRSFKLIDSLVKKLEVEKRFERIK
jgi:hypothetical protein